MGKIIRLSIFLSLVLTGCTSIPVVTPAETSDESDSAQAQPESQKKEGDECEIPGEEIPGLRGPLLCTYLNGMWAYLGLTGSGGFPGQLDVATLPVEECKLEDQRPLEARVGGSTSFPVVGNRIPRLGEVNIAFAAIDYPDAPGRETPLELMEETLRTIDAWNDFFTDGRVKFNWVVFDEWVRMPKDSEYYVEDKTKNDNGEIVQISNKQLQSKEEQIYQIFTEVEKFIDLESLDAAYILSNPEAKLVDFPTGYAADQKVTSASGSYDLSFWSIGTYIFGNVPEFTHNRPIWTSMLHETGHAQGLAGHAPGNEWTFDVMTSGGTLNAWNGWLMGWIPDDEIICLDGTKPATHKLKLDSVDLNRGGTIAAVIRLSDHEAIIVESRRKGPFSIDFQPEWEVIMAYLVDSKRLADRFDGNRTKELDYFSYFMRLDIPKFPYDPSVDYFDPNIFAQEGETLEHENVRIRFSSGGVFSTIEVEISRLVSAEAEN